MAMVDLVSLVFGARKYQFESENHMSCRLS
jgi:hypothetical protein